MSWENTFISWSQGPSQTEQDRCDNAVNMVTDALRNDLVLKRYNIEIFPQGSYRARTNVSQDSDVDICVKMKDIFFADYPMGINDRMVGNVSNPYLYSEFKNDIERALVQKFGRKQVKRGSKAFDIHANTYRVDADVVPTFEYRSYQTEKDNYGQYLYHEGVKLVSDKGQIIINWPNQTYRNGVAKNDNTSRKYKRTIRILKRLRNKMQEDGISAANNVASFLIECLVWNVPMEAFEKSSYTDIVRWVLAHTFNNTLKFELCEEWGEVNELKYLFRNTQPWTVNQAHNFLSAAWVYIGYRD